MIYTAGLCGKEAFPGQAKEYIRFIENAVGCKIKYVSVGANREDYFILD